MNFPGLPYDPVRPFRINRTTEPSVKIKQGEDKISEATRPPSSSLAKRNRTTYGSSDLDAAYELQIPNELETPADLITQISKILKLIDCISNKSTAEKREILQRENFFKSQLLFCKTVEHQVYYCMGVFSAIGCVDIGGTRYTEMLSNDNGVWGTLFRLHKQFCVVPELRQRYLTKVLQIASSAGFAVSEPKEKLIKEETVFYSLKRSR